MPIQSIATVPEQIKNQTQQVSGLNNSFPGLNKTDNETAPDFSALLMKSISGINKMQNSARGLSEDYITGKPGVALNDVMVSLQKSSVALNFGVQVRNKMVSAYQEIMSMAV